MHNDDSLKKKSRTEDNSQTGQLEEPNEKYCTSIQSRENVSTTSRIAGKKGVKILTKEILESEAQKSGGGLKLNVLRVNLINQQMKSMVLGNTKILEKL